MIDVESFIEKAIKDIGEQVSSESKAIIALSGGVDSSVCASLAHRAVGERLVAVYVDTGLMRKGETESIRHAFPKLNLHVVDAADRFLDALAGEEDPEKKRHIVGETFIRVFEEKARELDVDYLIQGTIYPDRIESEGGIKSHHNVGGMPTDIEFKGIVEPLADLYKDEVRQIARGLGLPSRICERMPFPGPGLSVRIVGEVTREKVEVAREANAIVEEEIVNRFHPWQALAAVVGKGTGVKGDVRVHGWVVVFRVVKSRDAMTANAMDLPWDVIERVASRITSEIQSVTHVAYDVTNKPPATIEFE